MSALMILLLIAISSCVAVDMPQDEQEHFDGRSFFFLGALFRRWRDRWLAFHSNSPGPLYAGAAFPINGYYNCPSFGCNPAAIGPQPVFYPAYYATPLQQQQQQQQQQQAQGNSNVYIYQTDQNSANSMGTAPYGSGYFGPARQPPPPPAPGPPPLLQPQLPRLPPPPSLPLPAGTLPPQATASSSFGFGSGAIGIPGPIPGSGPGPGPVPGFGCGPNSFACALG